LIRPRRSSVRIMSFKDCFRRSRLYQPSKRLAAHPRRPATSVFSKKPTCTAAVRTKCVTRSRRSCCRRESPSRTSATRFAAQRFGDHVACLRPLAAGFNVSERC
jgi:hypothetical protein